MAMTLLQLSEVLGDCIKAVETNSEPFDAAVDDLVVTIHEGINENFERAESGQGTPWPPHAPSTVARHGPHPLLILSGKMWDAATGGPGSWWVAADFRLSLGIERSAIPYASTQQFGSDRVPQREFYFINRFAMQDVKQILADYYEQYIYGLLDKASQTSV